ncbi:MAG: hypothetical protein PHH93_05990, partial [Prolixibacteraceae bacterium]|nr:hypothetical protein [Prolixibacteraceae bacterium]
MSKDLEAIKKRVVSFLINKYPGFPPHLNGIVSVLKEGRIANATVLRYKGELHDLVIKDFSGSPLIIRLILGRYFIRREAASLIKLSGISSVPKNAIIISPYTLAYNFIEGSILPCYKHRKLEKKFFLTLEKQINDIHKRGVIHMDLRCYRNIVVGIDGNPYIIDFQSSIFLKRIPVIVADILKSSDISGVYK